MLFIEGDIIKECEIKVRGREDYRQMERGSEGKKI